MVIAFRSAGVIRAPSSVAEVPFPRVGHSPSLSVDVTVAEIDFLLMHLWELREAEAPYYFFTRNCSYELLRLLEVAVPELDASRRGARGGTLGRRGLTGSGGGAGRLRTSA